MRRRYFYWPVSGLSVLIVVIVFIELRVLDESDIFGVTFFVLFAGYLVYFNYPTLQDSIKGSIRSLKGFSRGMKPADDSQDNKQTEHHRLIDKYLGDSNSAKHIYEFLGPIRFISDHYVYRLLTLVYAVVVTLLITLLYILAPPGFENTGDPLQDLLSASILVSLLIAYTSIPRFVSTKWRDYAYYLAKAYFALGETESELTRKFRYFIDGMEAYNVFLQRNIKIRIKDLQSYYSRLSGEEATVQEEIIKSIFLTFHPENEDLDELEPFRRIKQTMEKYYKKEDPMTGVSKKKNIQEWLPLLGLVISSAIAIIQMLAK